MIIVKLRPDPSTDGTCPLEGCEAVSLRCHWHDPPVVYRSLSSETRARIAETVQVVRERLGLTSRGRR
jgi:hypothetical protein